MKLLPEIKHKRQIHVLQNNKERAKVLNTSLNLKEKYQVYAYKKVNFYNKICSRFYYRNIRIC